jgi:hypothetical protein
MMLLLFLRNIWESVAINECISLIPEPVTANNPEVL